MCVCLLSTHIFVSISECVSVEFSVKGVDSKCCMMNFILSYVEPTLLIYDHKITVSTTVLLVFD